jgi:hypothetical protein
MSEQLNKLGSPSYAAPSRTREQTAEHIANGFPSPVSYHALKRVEINGLVYFKDATPVHLRRKVS